ncbi:MAG: hypothetical protein ACAH59_07770 [Pseudobdellovibrionaceae bacterium]
MKLLFFCGMFSLHFLISSTASAQEMMGDFLNPQPPSWLLRITGESAEPFSQQKAFVAAPVNTNATDPAQVFWKWSQLNLEPDQRLNNGQKLPQHLYSSEYGVGYKHVADESLFWGISASLGSTGDEVFSSRAKTVVSGTYFYSQSKDPTSRWLWLLNYSNNRTFANEIPIPGVAYIYRPSADFTGVFGFPFAFIRMKLNEDWTGQFFLGPFVYKAEFIRTLSGPLRFFALADHSLQSFYRVDRPRDEDRVFYGESRALIGFRSPLQRYLMAEVFAGAAYSRTALEEEDYWRHSQDAVSLENHWLVGGQLSLRY